MAKSEISFVSNSHYDPVHYVTTVWAVLVNLPKKRSKTFFRYTAGRIQLMGKIWYDIWSLKYNPAIKCQYQNLTDQEKCKWQNQRQNPCWSNLQCTIHVEIYSSQQESTVKLWSFFSPEDLASQKLFPVMFPHLAEMLVFAYHVRNWELEWWPIIRIVSDNILLWTEYV